MQPVLVSIPFKSLEDRYGYIKPMGSYVHRILVMDIPTTFIHWVFSALVEKLDDVRTSKGEPSFFAYHFPIPDEMCDLMKYENDL